MTRKAKSAAFDRLVASQDRLFTLAGEIADLRRRLESKQRELATAHVEHDAIRAAWEECKREMDALDRDHDARIEGEVL